MTLALHPRLLEMAHGGGAAAVIIGGSDVVKMNYGAKLRTASTIAESPAI